jgi:hypothetical protein
LTFPLVLTSTNLKVVSDVRLFTFKGEIKDTAIINKYLSVCDSSVFPVNKDLSIPVANRDSLIYLTADTLLFSKKWYESHNKLDKRIQKRNDGFLYFYNKDTTYLVREKSFFPSNGDEIDKIIFSLGIYKPVCAIQDLPEKFGYTYVIKYLGAYVAKGSYSKLEFPFLSYRFTRGAIGFPGIFYGRSSTLYNNKFDPNVIGFMKEGDTLAIKESLFVYENIQ